MIKHRIAICAVALLMSVDTDLPAAAATVDTFPGIFSTRTTQSSNISMFPKWGGALSRYFSERELADAPCTSSIFNQCHLKEWKEFLTSLRGESKLSQVRAVNVRRQNFWAS